MKKLTTLVMLLVLIPTLVLFLNFTKAEDPSIYAESPDSGSAVRKPIAVINGDITEEVNEGKEFKLDGSKSTVPNQKEIQYTWNSTCTQISIEVSDAMAKISIGEVEQDEKCEISLSVTDGKNTSELETISFKVKNIDTTPPVITISGADPLRLLIGQSYNDEGITASDDGKDIAFSRTGDLNTSVAGTYTLTYTATDAARNKTEVTRTIIITKRSDDSIGIIPISKYRAIISGKLTETQEINENEIIELDGSKSVVSNQEKIEYHWGSSCKQVELVGQKESIVNFKVEEVDQNKVCTISLSVSDGSEKSPINILKFTIKNTDKEIPVITLNGEATITLLVGDGYSDAGAVVSDDIDTNRTILLNGIVNTSVAGTYTLEYTATDLSGKSAIPVRRTVVVNNRPSSSGGYISIIPPVNPITPQVLAEKIVPQVLGEKITSDEPTTELDKAIQKLNLKFTRRLRKTNRDLKNNKEVSTLQEVLKDLGYFKYPRVTGYFGNYTEDAIKSFQKANGLEQVGYIGPKTLKLLNTL